MRIALTFLHSRGGGYAVAFALMLPVLAAFGAFVADQANFAYLQSRVAKAREAANLSVALESVQGNKSRAQLEAYAKHFFLANLGEEYAEATSVKLVMPKWPKVGMARLEAHVRYQSLLAPVYAAAAGRPGGEFAVDIR